MLGLMMGGTRGKECNKCEEVDTKSHCIRLFRLRFVVVWHLNDNSVCIVFYMRRDQLTYPAVTKTPI